MCGAKTARLDWLCYFVAERSVYIGNIGNPVLMAASREIRSVVFEMGLFFNGRTAIHGGSS